MKYEITVGRDTRPWCAAYGCSWFWSVYLTSGDWYDYGVAMTRWGARLAARRAAKQHAKRQDRKTYSEVLEL